jgi:hypothetical protein
LEKSQDKKTKIGNLGEINEEKDEISMIQNRVDSDISATLIDEILDEGEEEEEEEEEEENYDDSCDFSESNMLENATIALKMNPHQSKRLLQRVLDKKRSKAAFNNVENRGDKLLKKTTKKTMSMVNNKKPVEEIEENDDEDNTIMENNNTIINYDDFQELHEIQKKRSNSFKNLLVKNKEDIDKSDSSITNIKHPLTDPDNQNTNFTTAHNNVHTYPENQVNIYINNLI